MCSVSPGSSLRDYRSSDFSRPRTDRIAKADSLSSHSSGASMTTTVEMLVLLRGWTINLVIWLYSDSLATSGSDCINGMRTGRKPRYLCAS